MKLLCIATIVSLPTLGFAQTLSGRWDATVQFDNFKIPFPLEFSGQGDGLKASFFNGEERVTSTSGKMTSNSVVFRFDHYATVLDANLTDAVLKGTYGGKRSGFHEIEARPHRELARTKERAPDIAGLWDIPTESAKGEHAWRFIVHQSGSDISAAILRVDGDTGALTGTYQDGKFVLNHYDGSRAYVLEIVPQADHSLALTLKSSRPPVKNLVAVRMTEARQKGIPEPDDPATHTRMKDPNEVFQFSFPDLDGRLVSNTDPRFKNKVVLVNITGSWCPNCHDEAPYLEELYRRYRALGLEIVALDFEEPAQLEDKSRLRAFIKKYGIEYTYLVGGEDKEMQAKISQAEHLDSWPTTFFLGRDGRVRAIHAGFAAPASGELHTQLKQEIAHTIERLLAEHSENTSSAALR